MNLQQIQDQTERLTKQRYNYNREKFVDEALILINKLGNITYFLITNNRMTPILEAKLDKMKTKLWNLIPGCKDNNYNLN